VSRVYSRALFSWLLVVGERKKETNRNYEPFTSCRTSRAEEFPLPPGPGRKLGLFFFCFFFFFFFLFFFFLREIPHAFLSALGPSAGWKEEEEKKREGKGKKKSDLRRARNF